MQSTIAAHVSALFVFLCSIGGVFLLDDREEERARSALVGQIAAETRVAAVSVKALVDLHLTHLNAMAAFAPAHEDLPREHVESFAEALHHVSGDDDAMRNIGLIADGKIVVAKSAGETMLAEGVSIERVPALASALSASINAGDVGMSVTSGDNGRLMRLFAVQTVSHANHTHGHPTNDGHPRVVEEHVQAAFIELDMHEIVVDSAVAHLPHGMNVALLDPTGVVVGPMLFGNGRFDTEESQSVMQLGTWALKIAPDMAVWSAPLRTSPMAFWGFGVFLAIVLSTLTFVVIERPSRLRAAVAGATAALRESEARLRDYAEVSSDFLWSMDENLRFSYFSERFEAIARIKPTILLGKTREETGIPGLPAKEFEKHLDDLRNRRPFRDFIHPRAAHDGRIVWLSISGKPIFDESSKFRGYRGTGLDITSQVETLEELRSAKEAAEQAARMKIEFLANVSHELRTPLNSIIGFSEIMRDELFGELGDRRYTDYAENIHHSGTHLLEVINEILDTARMSAGTLTLHEEPVSIQKVIAAVMTMIRDRARQNGLRLSVEIDPNCGAVLVDRTRLKQILLNLMSNSVKFTPPAGIVTVRASVRVDDGVRFEVSDTGCGISPEDQRRVFEPFTQVQSVFARSHEGTGLGLPLVKSLTEIHGGTVTLVSETGVGTTVIVDLPPNRTLSRLVDAS